MNTKLSILFLASFFTIANLYCSEGDADAAKWAELVEKIEKHRQDWLRFGQIERSLLEVNQRLTRLVEETRIAEALLAINEIEARQRFEVADSAITVERQNRDVLHNELRSLYDKINNE